MIVIKISCTDGHSYIETSGHAEVDVCAAVSAIMQTAALGLLALATTNADAEVTLCELPEGCVRILPPEYNGAKTAVRPKRAK